jgi:hypothetical protein
MGFKVPFKKILSRPWSLIKDLDQGLLMNSLINAVENDDIDRVKKLINEGVNPSKDFNSALVIAAVLNHLGIIRILLKDPGVNINYLAPNLFDAYTPLDMATIYGHLEIVDYLLADSKIEYVDRGIFLCITI